jgi:hypothetical protein
VKRLAITLSLLLTLLLSAPAAADYWPLSGDLSYNGYTYADSYMNWGSSPGPFWEWAFGYYYGEGYEHDFKASRFYFTSCTSSTNLPYGYDDCPTAGQSETEADYWVFSFGSYHGTYIQPNTTYFGSWNFGVGPNYTTDAWLRGQRTQHMFCNFDNVWCMGATSTHVMLNPFLVWGQSRYYAW